MGIVPTWLVEFSPLPKNKKHTQDAWEVARLLHEEMLRTEGFSRRATPEHRHIVLDMAKRFIVGSVGYGLIGYTIGRWFHRSPPNLFLNGRPLFYNTWVGRQLPWVGFLCFAWEGGNIQLKNAQSTILFELMKTVERRSPSNQPPAKLTVLVGSSCVVGLCLRLRQDGEIAGETIAIYRSIDPESKLLLRALEVQKKAGRVQEDGTVLLPRIARAAAAAAPHRRVEEVQEAVGGEAVCAGEEEEMQAGGGAMGTWIFCEEEEEEEEAQAAASVGAGRGRGGRDRGRGGGRPKGLGHVGAHERMVAERAAAARLARGMRGDNVGRNADARKGIE